MSAHPSGVDFEPRWPCGVTVLVIAAIWLLIIWVW